MKHTYKISPALAWQNYDCIDMLFILNRKNCNFYFFRNSGRVIVESILQMHTIQYVYELCKELYDVSEEELSSALNYFVELLLREELIYEPNADN